MVITLIGLPSSGKSTLGVLLAKELGLSFIDSDLIIQEKENALLSEVIKEKGRDGFVKIEEKVNLSLSPKNAVISTGGSAVYSNSAMAHFKKLGVVVYLEISFDDLETRLGDYTHRGVLMKEGQTLHDLWQERVPLYEKWADITVKSDGTLHESVKRLLEKFRE